jgi:FkbM family methyltransferase
MFILAVETAPMVNLAKQGLSIIAFGAYKAAENETFRRMIFNSIRLNRTETERFSANHTYRFLAYVFLNRHRSKSQILQDLWVNFELGEKRGGFFVEFGAASGLQNSNTWLLEKEQDWNGILVEPNPFWHAALKDSRSATIDYRCVHPVSGERVTFLATDAFDPELSGIAKYADGDHFAETRAKGKAIEVETITLDDLFRQHDAPDVIDYLSVDTEGSEFAILSKFDFSRRIINLISVEQNRKTETKIEGLLKEQGFNRVFKEFSQWDGWYVRANFEKPTVLRAL